MVMKLASKDAEYPHKVSVPVPDPDGGEPKAQEFTARFKLLSTSELQKLRLNDKRFIAAVLVGWEGILDADGQDLPFSETARDALADERYVVSAIAQAYQQFSSGAPEKNFESLLATL